jgi:hypothetical protein
MGWQESKKVQSFLQNGIEAKSQTSAPKALRDRYLWELHTGCCLSPPIPLIAAKAGSLQLNKSKTPFLPTGIGEGYSQPISMAFSALAPT